MTPVNPRMLLALVLASFGIALLEPVSPMSAAGLFLPAERQDARGSADPESFEKLAERARAAMDADRVPEAIRLYERATGLRPDWSEGWWHLGTLLFDARRFGEARDAFADFVRIERKQPGPGFGMLGLSAFQVRHYARALPDLERGTQLGLGTNPDFTRTVLYHDAIVNALLGHPEI